MFNNKAKKIMIEKNDITEQSCSCDICGKELIHAIKYVTHYNLSDEENLSDTYTVDYVSETPFVIAEIDYENYQLIPYQNRNEFQIVCENCIKSYIMQMVNRTNNPIKIRSHTLACGQVFFGSLEDAIIPKQTTITPV